MIVLLSIGVGNYLSSKVHNLCSIAKDANDIYKLFSNLGGDDFSHERSTVQMNISSNQFSALLDSSCSSLGENDIFILYFSGHASLNGNELLFYFEDVNPDSEFRGKVSFSSVRQVLCNVKNSVICIFDCCNSGATIKSVISPEIFKKSKLTILASSSAYDTTPSSIDSKVNSPFTLYLIDYIQRTYSSLGKVTFSDLVRCFKSSDYEKDVIFHVEEGSGDIIILESKVSELTKIKFDFSNQFYNKLIASDIRTREMLWYSLKDIPSIILVDIFDLWIKNGFIELSWLVRRAVGSILASKIEYDDSICIIIDNLLDSKHWSDHCIGIIGARFSLIKDDKFTEKVKKLFFGKNRMDVVWLAHLYLTDAKKIDIKDSLSVKLSNSLWGLTDIFERYKNKFDNILIERLIEASEAIGYSEKFKLHMNLTYPDVEHHFSLLNDKHQDVISLMNFMYKKDKRNRIIDQDFKWLLSVLFGEWRGQLNLSIDDHLSSFTTCELHEFLNNIGVLPSVECRMAIFQYISMNPDKKDFLSEIRWIDSEKHPWVRREAVDVFFKFDRIGCINYSDIGDIYIYPGYTDLILSYINSGLLKELKIETSQLTGAEIKALEKYILQSKF